MNDNDNAHRPRILIADDEKSIANAIAAMMEMSDMEPIVVNDGHEANNALITGEADAAILDVMMPGMSGFDVLKAARSRGDKTPILMLTALTTIDDKMNGFDSGADDYLPKPFDMRELIARVSILAKQQPYASGSMNIGGVTLNMSKSMLTNENGASLPITDTETSIISYLYAHRPVVRIARLAEIASTASGNDVSDGSIELAAATATSKLRQIGSTVSIGSSDGKLMIHDVTSKEENDNIDANADSGSQVNVEGSKQSHRSGRISGHRSKPSFPWRIGR